MTDKPIAIIGAGNGGQTTAAWLANQGYQTRIFDVMDTTVAKLNELGGVNIYGNTDYPGFGKIEFATTDMEKAIEDCELILLILPENYHDSIAKKMAPYLKDGQIVVLNPASGLAAISFKKTLTETGDVLVTGQKTELSIVAFPGNRRKIVEDAMYPVFSQHIFANNIIDTAMENLNLAFHPGPTLLYTSLIERGITFDYYNEMTPSQIKLIKAIDKERMELCRIFHVDTPNAEDSFARMYSYKGIKGPKSLKVRYLLEDIPYNLRFLQALGQIAKIQTPVIDAVCTLGEALVGGDMDEGYTLKTLGLDENMTVDEFLKLVNG